MAVIKGNDFSHDTDDIRQARLALLSKNIDTYAGEINVAGVHLTWAQGGFASPSQLSPPNICHSPPLFYTDLVNKI